ncbi:MAG: hypothetical protein MUO53_14385 [Maribacter sp.]|nr:hypothetical protein [Maribacter sp.]
MHRLSLAIMLFLGALPLLAQSPHGDQLRMDCVKCHDPSGWTVNYATIQFDHSKTSYPLEGAHAQTDCKLCHSTLIFQGAPTDCVSCHTDVHSQSVGNDCVRCHTTQTWLINNITEVHEENGFPLIGAHNNLSCVECHTSETNLRFDRVGNDCISCHSDDYASTLNPNHEAAGFSKDCIECHSPLGFGWNAGNIANINHDFFPLTLGHDIQDCTQCHKTANYSDASPECISCHQEDYASTLNPNHSSAGFSNDCASCHTTNPGWKPATLNHDFFPLTQGHNIQDCTQCHTNGTYAGLSPECLSCHQGNYDQTSNPNHQTSGFSTDCVQCHTTNPGWTPANINHDFFPLTQGHNIQDCTQCHTNGTYAGLSPECVSCHQDNYDQTTNPNHQTVGFSTDCVQCHTTSPGWTPANINHDFFPLTQGHNIQDCTQCHTTGSYVGLSPECVSCHQDNYDQTTNPSHMTVGFSTDCASCHTTNPGWAPATVNHDFFPLTQGHNIQDCTQCHTTGSYVGLSPECVSCHQANYDQTSNPNHQTNGFSTDCVLCHTTNPGWAPATINHDFFPLTQGHNIQDCTQCHTTGSYVGLSPECVSCHQDNYNQTTNPNHQTSGFSTDCASCHTTNLGWTPATINHDFFPLTQGHTIQDCAQCHTNGTYAGLSPDCVTCHQNDYNQTTNPNHQAASFPTDCASCHTTRPGWTPATFDHDGQYFPIYTGKHRKGQAWNDCVECHPNPNSYAEFSCFQCHLQRDMDDKHSGMNGYSYVSSVCLQCHPDGTKP